MSSPTPSPLGRLLRYAGPYRWRVRGAVLASVLNKIFDLAPPLLIGLALDVVAGDGAVLERLGIADPRQQLWALAGFTVLIWGLESIFEYVLKVLWRNLAQSLQHDLRIDAYAHAQGLEMAFFEERSTGGLMSVLNDDVNQLERFLDGGANAIVQVCTTVLVIGAVFFWIAPGVAWMSMLPMPFVLWGSFAFQHRLQPRYAAVREEVSALNAELSSNLGGIATIKSFTAEEREVERIRQRSDAYRQVNRAAIRLSSAFSPLIRMVIVCGFVGTMVAGGYAALSGEMSGGAFATMVFLTQRLLWPLTQLGDTFDLYQRAMASTARILDLLSTRPAIRDGVNGVVADARGDLKLEGINFTYPNGAHVLSDLNLEFRAGLSTAIVGSTGSGKTSIIKLLLRFYDPQEGSITLGGVDIADLPLSFLRGETGLVSQDVFLFHGTVLENIAYGRPGASRAEIEDAARAAEADDFIRALPQGYETLVGERGQKLSGGQRQRLSIARAVLKDPPILILDEATSSVDNETEAAIQRSLARITCGRTTIVIAHRLSTVRNADRIYVLDGGRVREMGSHDELVQRGGIYATLWGVQTGEPVAG